MMQHNCFQHHQISILERLISERSCDTQDWSNDAENGILPSLESVIFYNI